MRNNALWGAGQFLVVGFNINSLIHSIVSEGAFLVFALTIAIGISTALGLYLIGKIPKEVSLDG